MTLTSIGQARQEKTQAFSGNLYFFWQRDSLKGDDGRSTKGSFKDWRSGCVGAHFPALSRYRQETGPLAGLSRPLPADRHNKKLVFPSNYTHGFGPPAP